MGTFALDNLNLNDNHQTILQGSFKRVFERDGRRSIIREQIAEYNMLLPDTACCSKKHEKERKPKPKKDHLIYDIDPFLISGPLLEAISQLPKDLDVRLEVCRPGSWVALESLLREKEHGYYDLVHFDMHGAVLTTEGAGLYFLSPETQPDHERFGTKAFVPAAKIGALLYEAGIVMVALNACETAREGPIGESESMNEEPLQDLRNDQSTGDVLFNSEIQTNLAKVFVMCGIPAVLAMSYIVIPSSVTIFYQSFYKALLLSECDVPQAVSSARQALLSQKQRAVDYGLSVELADWIIPVLYQSQEVTFSIVSPNKIGPANKLPDHEITEPSSSRKKLFRRLFPKSSISERIQVVGEDKSAAQQSTDRVIGRGLEVLYVEALLLNTNSRRTLCLSGGPGIGKTHFVKGLANYWLLTGCISNEALCIDCFANPDWRAMDILREIVRRVANLELSTENVEKTQQILYSSRTLIVLDNVEERNLSLKPEDKNAKQNLQSLIQSLHGGQSVMIIASREELRSRSRLLNKKTRDFIEFWKLSELNELAMQEMALEILRKLDKNTKLETKYETKDLGRVLQCLDQNPLVITLFLKTMSEAGLLTSMKGVLHNILFGIVPLPLIGPESRMVCVAQKAYADLSLMNNGQDLQKLLLCLSYFNNVIPCSFDEKVFFPSAKCYLGYLKTHFALPWPASADRSIVRESVELSKDPSQLRVQLLHLARDSEDSFCVLIEHLLGTRLVGFTIHDQLDKTSHKAIRDYYDGKSSTRKILTKLNYLRISPVLTHYLRGQMEPQTSNIEIISRPHGISPVALKSAYCLYLKSFSVRGLKEHDSRHTASTPQTPTADPEAAISPSDVVLYYDAANFYSAVHIAIDMPHPKLRWELTPVWGLLDLVSKGMRTFNTMAAYKHLRTGAFTEEAVLSMLRVVLSYYDSAPRGERDSFTPLTIAALLSNAECWLMSFIGGSEYSDVDVYLRQITTRMTKALVIMKKLRILYHGRGEPPDSSELLLLDLLKDTSSQNADTRRFRRVVGDERYRQYLDDRREDSLYAVAVRRGVLGNL